MKSVTAAVREYNEKIADAKRWKSVRFSVEGLGFSVYYKQKNDDFIYFFEFVNNGKAENAFYEDFLPLHWLLCDVQRFLPGKREDHIFSEKYNVTTSTDTTENPIYAASLEQKSEHPLGRAVVSYADSQNIGLQNADDFVAESGKGLCAKLDGRALRGGNAAYIAETAEIPEEISQKASELAETGKTPMIFSQDGKVIGVIAVADVIRDDSVEAIAEFKKMGLKTVMLTGDNQKTADAIAKQVGVDEVIAGVLPDGKKDAVEKHKKDGMVIMVGDGINDAPALAAADVGMAVGAGTDIAIDSADVVITGSSLMQAAGAVSLSRHTLRNIKENLFWAFIYNIIGIPLAAGVFISLLGWELNPMFGAAAMSLSSFCVVTNALRLNFFKMKKSAVTADEIKENTEIKKEQSIMEKKMKIEGMMCGHCSGRVKAALEAVGGVESAQVSHETGVADVKLTKEVSNEALKSAVEKEGYKVISVE